MNAIKCAIAKPDLVKVDCVEMNENPELTERFNVGSVPHTIFNSGAHEALGLMPEERFVVEMVYLKSAEDLLAEGALPGRDGKRDSSQYGSIEPGEVDLVIIGAGPAGLTAGIYAVRAGLKAVVLEKSIVGGQVALTPVVENYPGFATVPGKQLMDIMSEHAREYVPVHEGEAVDSIEIGNLEKGETIAVTTTRGAYSAKAILLATGASYRKLGATGEDRYFGRGINYCASCDGYLYKGKKVAIIGGGNTALTDALHLKNLGVDVTIIHRGDAFRAQKPLQDSVAHEQIPIIWNTAVKEHWVNPNKPEPVQVYRYDSDADKLTLPTMIFIGEYEQYQRRRSIETAVKSMKEAGRDVTLITYPGVGRGFDFRPPTVRTFADDLATKDSTRRMADFFAKHLKAWAKP